MLFCAECMDRTCARKIGQEGAYPANCPSTAPKQAEYLEWYKDPADAMLARVAAECGPDHSEGRVEKTVRFARMCGYRKLGVAFCITLAKEAKAVCRLLTEAGFEVESILCKVGHQDRAVVGYPGSAVPMCNPIAQAELLNEAGTELNILVGLCVGHDTLFIRHSNAPVTVLVAKDHVYHDAPMEYLRSEKK